MATKGVLSELRSENRTVQILEDQILARPIFYFVQYPEAPDLKKGLITGTGSEIKSLKKSET